MDRYIHAHFMHMYFHADIPSGMCMFMQRFVHALVRLFTCKVGLIIYKVRVLEFNDDVRSPSPRNFFGLETVLLRAYVDPQRNQEWALKEHMASGDNTILI